MNNILPLVTHPDERLRRVAQALTATQINSPEMQQLCEDMIKTMYADDGIGLAAPQVARDARLIIIGKDAVPSHGQDLVIFNPELSNYSLKTAHDEEGCLSVPSVIGDVERHVGVTLNGLSRTGQPFTMMLKDFAARVAQHECDHLNGILFIDRAINIRTTKKRGAL